MKPQAQPPIFFHHIDPGHSWFAVKRELLIGVGVLHLTSPYSYQRGDTVYLEEDCDAPRFFAAYSKYVGAFRIRESVCGVGNRESSPIRGYASLQVTEHERRVSTVCAEYQAQMAALKDAGRLEVVIIR